MAKVLLAGLPKAAPVFDATPRETGAQAQAQAAQSPVANLPIANVQMLVTMAVDGANAERRKQARDTSKGLDKLEDFHRAVLKGEATPGQLQAIADWVAQSEVPSDPKLAAIFRDIDVRVRVELAKYDVQA